VASIAVALRLGSRRRGPARMPAPLDTWSVDLYGQDRAGWRDRAQRNAVSTRAHTPS